MSLLLGCSSLPRYRRLSKRRDYLAVFETGRRSTDSLFTVVYRPNGLAHARLGLAVTRRRVRAAVGRSRIKRQVRESFRRQQELLVGLDVVVLAQSSVLTAPNQVLQTSLTWHWLNLQSHSATCLPP